MSMSDKIAAFLATQRKKNNQQTASNTTTIYGYAASDSSNGQVEVYIPGADVIQPDNADNTVGNTVTAPIIGSASEGDPITILGVGNGIVDTPVVLGGAGFGDKLKNTIASVAATAAAAIERVADETAAAIGAINQHFWTDDNGVHVTSEVDDATTGPNLLANSIGVLLRDGTTVMSAQTPSGFTVYDGRGNTAEHVVATFGADCVIGSIDGQHMLISDDQMTLLIPAWEEYEQPTYVYKTAFHVGYVEESHTQGGMTYINRYPYYDLGERSTAYNVGQYSTIIGRELIADQTGQIVLGRYNAADSTAAFVIGAGYDDNNRSNLLTITTGGQLRCASINVSTIYATDARLGTVQATGAITGASLTTTGNITSTAGDISGDDITATGDLSVGGNSTITGNETVTGTVAAGDLTKNSMSVLGYDVLYNNSGGSWSGDLVLADHTIFGGGTGNYYKRVDIFFKDSDGHYGSVSMWAPDNLQQVQLSTSGMWASGFSTKSRTVQIVAGRTLRTLTAYYQSGVEHFWHGQFIIDSASARYEEGSYIGITSVIGYK